MAQSQSPQTGQVYFNLVYCSESLNPEIVSQSPQTGQVYFNWKISFIEANKP